MKRAGPGDARLARRLKRRSDALQWADVDASSFGADSGIATLPPSLLRDRVFTFLAPSPTTVRASRRGIEIDVYKEQLAPLRAVCQHWFTLAQFLLVEASKKVFSAEFSTGTPAERSRILRRARREGGDHVEQVAVVMGRFALYSSGPFELPEALEGGQLCDSPWWEAFFKCFPQVVRLDLSRLGIHCTSVVLDTAAKVCPAVKEVEISCGGTLRSELYEDELVELPRSLRESLQSWHTANGGLRVLTVPYWIADDTVYSEFLAAVSSYCPDIEYLLPGSTTQSCNSVLRYYQPEVPIEVWAQFCNRCIRLRHFSWIIGTFSMRHVELFLESPKPQLESLELNAQVAGWWHDIMDLSPVMKMLTAVPQLKVFEFSLVEAPDGHRIPRDALNELIDHITKNCISLEALAVEDVRAASAINTIESETLEALVAPGLWRFLTANCVAFDPNTLVKIVESMKLNRYPKRYLDIVSFGSIHAAVFNLLKHLDANSPEHFSPTTLEFHVYGGKRTGPWNDPYQLMDSRADVKQLVASIKTKYSPWLSNLRVEVENVTIGDKRFETIVALDLMFNIRQRRVEEECVDFDENGLKVVRGGVFDASEYSFRQTENFYSWEESKR